MTDHSLDFDFGLPGLRRENQRPRRVATAIGRELRLLLMHRTRDPRLLDVSITRVEMSPDLKQAVVYFGLPAGQGPGRALAGLRRAQGFFRSSLARSLNMRYTPRLVFRHDSSLDDIERMEALLSELRREGDGHDPAA